MSLMRSRPMPMATMVAVAGAGNGVAFIAAGNAGQAQGHELLTRPINSPSILLALARFSLISTPEWPPFRPSTVRRDAGAVHGLPLGRQLGQHGGAAGAGHGENALILGVQIDESHGGELGHIDVLGTGHAGLLVHGDKDLNGRVENGGITPSRPWHKPRRCRHRRPESSHGQRRTGRRGSGPRGSLAISRVQSGSFSQTMSMWPWSSTGAWSS